jgi:hypothetical protein
MNRACEDAMNLQLLTIETVENKKVQAKGQESMRHQHLHFSPAAQQFSMPAAILRFPILINKKTPLRIRTKESVLLVA